MPRLVPVEFDPFTSGDPEAAGAAQASQAMEPVTGPYLRDVVTGRNAMRGLPQNYYDPQRSFAQNATDPQALNQAMNIAMSVGPGAIRAYHGSPYDFSKFDLSKIGTGEGAQAYGHGLYFAERPETAEAYKIGLSRNPVDQIKVAIKDRLGLDASDEVANSLYGLARHYNMGLDGAAPDWNAVAKTGAARTPEIREFMEGGFTGNNPRLAKFFADLADIPRGRMYEVNINAEPEQFLNWDKPLSGQPAPVRNTLSQLGIKPPQSAYSVVPDESGYFRVQYPGENGAAFSDRLFKTQADAERAMMSTANMQGHNPTGGEIYESSKLAPGDTRNSAAASNVLRDAGIPGIRYLDQGSRGAGDGTSNYVVFSPELITILRKYGMLGPAAGLGASALQDDSVR